MGLESMTGAGNIPIFYLPSHDNTLNRFTIEKYDYKAQGSVTIFEHSNCTG